MGEQGAERPDRVRETVRRVLVLLAVALAGVATGRLVVLVLSDSARTAAPTPVTTVSPSAAAPGALQDSPVRHGPLRRAARLLHAWDAERAAAYARGDPALLRRLYVPRSRAAATDVRTLEAYTARGLVVRGLRTQVLSLRVLASGRGRLKLEVTDRLVGGHAVLRSAGDQVPRRAHVALPRDGPSTRVLVLHRRAGAWRMGSVRPA